MVVAREDGDGFTVYWGQFHLGMMKTFWRWRVVMVTQHCERTQCHWTIH